MSSGSVGSPSIRCRTAGAGTGSNPCSQRTVPWLTRNCAARHLVHVELAETGHHTHDVGDRVERADLVKVHVPRMARRVPRLGLREHAKHAAARLLSRVREGRFRSGSARCPAKCRCACSRGASTCTFAAAMPRFWTRSTCRSRPGNPSWSMRCCNVARRERRHRSTRRATCRRSRRRRGRCGRCGSSSRRSTIDAQDPVRGRGGAEAVVDVDDGDARHAARQHARAARLKPPKFAP